MSRPRERGKIVLRVDFAADDGLAAFGWEIRFVRGFAVAEAPGQEGVVNELCQY